MRGKIEILILISDIPVNGTLIFSLSHAPSLSFSLSLPLSLSLLFSDHCVSSLSVSCCELAKRKHRVYFNITQMVFLSLSALPFNSSYLISGSISFHWCVNFQFCFQGIRNVLKHPFSHRTDHPVVSNPNDHVEWHRRNWIRPDSRAPFALKDNSKFNPPER